jgi:hypothetical protein
LKDRGKRAAVAAAAAIMVVAFAGPAASGPTGRTVTKPYSGAHGATAGQAYAFWSIGFEHQVFEPRARERSVVITIEDKSGLPTRGHVWVGGDDGYSVEFCSESEPIALEPGDLVYFFALIGTCPDATAGAGVATSGSVTATFSR